jgi:hypothetical protein
MVTDPVTLATVTTALTHLALKALDGTLGEAGKALWNTITQKLGWSTVPTADSLPTAIATQLKDNAALTSELVALLEANPEVGTASAIVGHIQARNVITAGTLNNPGTINMS